ncbi:MAG: biotin/lipoyl-binding protein [Oscillospiraceae bacterium]|nr:biotin/lipoyl-binding protein [Oscillospiraceae bacterium]
MKNKTKKIIAIVLAVVILLGAGGGAWYYFSHKNVEPVYVFPFNYVGMTEYWGDSQESYGPVSTDKIQTVYLSDTQTVTEILVSVGDTVKKGDLLMSFDTTLSDLALERKRLDVEKLKLQLQDAQTRLREIRSMKPMVIPTVQETPDKDLGTALGAKYKISGNRNYDGSKKSLALICWISEGQAVTDELLEELRLKAEEFQTINANDPAKQPSSASPLPGILGGGDTETVDPETGGAEQPPVDGGGGDPGVNEPVKVSVSQFYVIFKVNKGDMSLGQRLAWTGLIVNKVSDTFVFRFFDASAISDHMLADMGQEAEKTPEIDFGSGYTAAQISQMRSEQEKKIKDLEFNIKMAEADYKIALTEANDGKVYAQIDGKVVSVLTEEEAKLTMQPVLKVSGGGGFYVEGSVSELEKDNMRIGQEVTINDWNTGMTYTGTVQSLGDFPSSNNSWNGTGNPNASFYPFTVYIGEEADLQEGRYVSVMYSTATSEHGIYLQNPFLRTEQGKSFVYVLGEDGRLEQRFVKTGKALWGSYTEILSGLTEEDLVAFPYGKNVKSGAVAEEGDLSNLYG